MPGAGQLLRAGETGWTAADYRHAFARFFFREDRRDPTFFPTIVDDCAFDGLNRDRVVVDIQRAGFLTRCGANPTSEFWKIVG